MIAGALTTSRADAVLVDPSDRLVAAGSAFVTAQDGSPASHGLLVRIAASKLDTSFGFVLKRTFAVDGEAVTAIVNIPLGGYFVA